MELSEVKKCWQSQNSSPSLRRAWEAVAPSLAEQPEPASKEHGLLRLLERKNMITHGCRVLDLGCGAGRYSLAMARRGARVTGLDISERAVRAASGKAGEGGLENAEFRQFDWDESDPAEHGWEGAFDLSLAWLTPAVRDYAGFEKFCRTSRGWCVFANHIARDESLSDRFRSHFGLRPVQTAESDLIYAFATLLHMKKRPVFISLDEFWERRKSVDELFEKYLLRLEASQTVKRQSRERLRAFLEAEAGGEALLCERLSATIGVLYWRV